MSRTKPLDPMNYKRARQRAGLSFSQAADAIGCSRVAVLHWEAGRREPGASSLVAMSRAYGCSTDQLLGLWPIRF